MNIEINNQTVKAESGESILKVLNRIGIKIPTLCYLEDLFPSGACRMCLVEVEGARNLVSACSFEVFEGMKIKTHSPRVIKARKSILELLLARHPDDCLYCNKNGSCELQQLSEELGIKERRFSRNVKESQIDYSSPSIVRDPSKCILCGRCVRVCEEIQGVSAIDFTGRGSQTVVDPAFHKGINLSGCVNCGQCIMVCPTGALTEKSNIKEVLNAIHDPDKIVVVQHAPAISLSIGEYFDFKAGSDVAGILNSGLRKAGFDKVFDTSFSADLTVMEEATELVHRIQTNGTLPMMTSCSPGWIKFVEHNYPELLDNLSTCKSPQQMLGTLIKDYFAKLENIDPAKIFSVSIMPCTAKKFEASREEMMHNGHADIDAALTTRELAKIFQLLNIDLKNLEPEEADNPFSRRSSSGKIFGVTGGVMEAAVRTAYYLITKKDLPIAELKDVRDLDGIKEAVCEIKDEGVDLKVNVAVVNGLANARKILEDIKKNENKYHFIEVMTCPGGCIGGGGQPFAVDKEKLNQRAKGLYKIDKDTNLRYAYKNEEVKEIYDKYLEKPLSDKSHHLLHTKYKERKDFY